MKRTIALSVLDQAVLSAQSMFVSLLLIWLADAEAVGRFALALSLYFSFLTVQDSLFGSILANRVYGRSVEEQRGTIGMVSTLSLSMMIAAAVLTAAAAAWIGFDAELVMATVAMTVAGMLRELARAVAIALGDMRRCVRVDAAAAVLTCVPLPLLLQMVAPEVACLASIALGHAVATLVFKPRLHVSIGQLPAKITAYRDLLAIAKWSLVAGVSAEVKSRTFLILVGYIRGLTATATIHAGRLVVNPVALLTMAIGRIVLPRMAYHFHEGEPEKAYSIIRQAAGVMMAVTICYAVALYLSWPLLQEHLFRGRYPEIAETVLAWMVLSFVSTPLWCLHWLFRSLERFRELALVGFANMVCVLAAMTCLALPVPLNTAIIILILGDLAFTGTLLWLLHDRRQPRETAT